MRPLTRPVTHGLTRARAVTGVVALVVVMLAACATVGPPAARPTLTFANQPPLNLDVAEIRLAKREPTLGAAPCRTSDAGGARRRGRTLGP